MDKLTVFVAMVLVGVLRGLLQRRHVKAELEERLMKAKARPVPRKLTGRLKTDTEVDSASQVHSEGTMESRTSDSTPAEKPN